MYGGDRWAGRWTYLITLTYTLKDDHGEISCYVHRHDEKIEEKI